MNNALDLVRQALTALPHTFRQDALTAYGITLLALVPAGILWSRVDRRTVGGESVATKPIRFLLSIGVHALTLSWMFGFVRPDRLGALPAQATVWIVLASSTWEIACIVWQAMRARMSHFNRSTSMDSAIFISMGIFATLLVLADLPLAWEIARRPAENALTTMTMAVIAGLLVTCFVGGGTGVMMGMRNSHGVGREGRRVPLFGWSATSGDLRPPHFLSIHALQALPLLAAATAVVAGRDAGRLFAVVAIIYCLLIGVTLIRALRGRPIILAAVFK